MESLEELSIMAVLVMGNLYASLEDDSSVRDLPAVISWMAIAGYIGTALVMYVNQAAYKIADRRKTGKDTKSQISVVSILPSPATVAPAPFDA